MAHYDLWGVTVYALCGLGIVLCLVLYVVFGFLPDEEETK
jgi:hypothetical protein